MDYHQILPKLFVGSYVETAEDIDRLRHDAGVTAVLNLQTDDDMRYFKLDWDALIDYYKSCGMELRRVPVRDVYTSATIGIDRDATLFEAMVNAVADQVHGVDRSDLVVAGALDPFKNRAKRFYTVAPLAFMRKLLCVSKGSHPHATCKTPVKFDVWSHHPYTFGGPFAHARQADNVSLGDLPRMNHLLQQGVKLHAVVSTQPVQFWVTEFAWDTNPPRAHAVPLQLEARWTAEAFYQMWRSGVSLATWFLLQDAPGRTPYKSGLYFGGRPIAKARAKPTLKAFRFPFVAYLQHGVIHIWGRDATSDKKLVTIQLRHGGRWRTVARVRTNIHGILLANLHLNASTRDWMRARATGSGTSRPGRSPGLYGMAAGGRVTGPGRSAAGRRASPGASPARRWRSRTAASGRPPCGTRGAASPLPASRARSCWPALTRGSRSRRKTWTVTRSCSTARMGSSICARCSCGPTSRACC